MMQGQSVEIWVMSLVWLQSECTSGVCLLGSTDTLLLAALRWTLVCSHLGWCTMLSAWKHPVVVMLSSELDLEAAPLKWILPCAHSQPMCLQALLVVS